MQTSEPWEQPIAYHKTIPAPSSYAPVAKKPKVSTWTNNSLRNWAYNSRTNKISSKSFFDNLKNITDRQDISWPNWVSSTEATGHNNY